MPDQITLPGAKSYPIHPEGQFAAQCVDLIDLGQRVKISQQSGDRYLSPDVALVFATGQVDEQKRPLYVARQFTLSSSPKSHLVPFLESWRGKKYTAKELQDGGIRLDKLVSQPALISVAHTASGDKTYANIISATALPDLMKKALPNFAAGYERDPYWAKKKAGYAEDVAKFGGQSAAPPAPSGDDFTGDVPF